MDNDYFPQGLAEGHAFLGRESEWDQLIYNIKQGHHTLLLAPRCSGKTSLARKVLRDLKLPCGEANFYLSRLTQSVEAKILAAVQSIVNEVGWGVRTF